MHNILILGDSYSTFKGFNPVENAIYYDGETGTNIKSVEETWWHQLIEDANANLVLNDSWSGATICHTGRISPEYAYKSSFVTRLRLLIKEDFFKKNKIDTVFVFGGTNDSWLSVNPDGLPVTTPLGEPLFEGWCEQDLYSTLPAICYIIALLKKELPNGNVIFIINTDLDRKITDTIKSASSHFGTSYIELKPFDKEFGHPTVKGMHEIFVQISEELKQGIFK